MMRPFVHRSASRAGILLSLFALAACNDGGEPLAPVTVPEAPALEVAQITCTAKVKALSVTCGQPNLGGARGIIVGGQREYVTLTSSDLTYDAGTTEFAFDVTVENLIVQAMGTTDGVTGTADGVRVFFYQEPTVLSGTGTISIGNADGTSTFTEGVQAYYQYAGADLGADGILTTNDTSEAKNWVFQVSPTVEEFVFRLQVSASVPLPNGWIEMSPAADTMLTSASQSLTATVRDFVGRSVDTATVAWATSDAAVATVDGAGLATGVAPGAATITATWASPTGPATGQVTLAICPDLPVGGVYTAVMPGAASLCLAGGASGQAEYTYSPINLSASTALSLSLTGSGIVPVSGPPSPNIIPGAALLGRAAMDAPQLDETSHVRRLERERSELSRLMSNPAARVKRDRPRGGRDGARFAITPGVPAVGDLWNLNVAQGCTGTLDMRAGRVRAVRNHVIIVADTTNPAGGFTTAQYDSIAAEFDTLAYAVDTTNFGGPTDLDQNQRVVAFYTRAVNELSPPASSVVTLGYVTARDLFSSAPGSCTLSNEGEIFYMLVPDPTGAVNSNVRTVSSVRGSTVGTLAHEFQHLINASRRIYINEADVFEEVWLNEGLSHIAEELVFYRTSVGLTPRSNIVVGNLTTGPNASRRVAAFNTYANQNFGRLRSWLQRPDTAGSFKNNDALAVRGAIWAFLRYAADRKGGTEADTWFALVNSLTAGTANIGEVIGASPNDWQRDWIAAMYADDAVTGIATEYTNPSWNFRSLYIALNASYQLVPRTLSNNTALTLSYSRGGGTAYARFGVPTGSFAGVTALSGGVIPSSPYALIVTRTK